MAQHTQSRKLTIDSKFLTGVEEDPRRKSVLLDPVLTNHEGLVKDKKAGSSLGCSDSEMVELRILRGGSKALRTRTLNFWRANFSLFKEKHRLGF